MLDFIALKWLFSGTFRVLAEDCSQFTLGDEFDSDFHQALNCERYTLGLDSVPDEPLIDRHENTFRGSYVSHHQREISRYYSFYKYFKWM